jgi:hypothetical protein
MRTVNGSGSRIGPDDPEDWFDEVIETIEVMSPIVLGSGLSLPGDPQPVAGPEPAAEPEKLPELAHAEG